MDDPLPAAAPEEFYVGYLPFPAGHRRLFRFIVPAILWLMAAVASLVAAQMRDAGRGFWSASERSVFVGTLDVSPYPILRQAGRDPAKPGEIPCSYLLVEAGKLGGRSGLEEFEGRTVRVTGSLLERDGRAMIELSPGVDAVRSIDTPSPPLPAPAAAGRITLRGEIVDSKCYLGAMRPGEGKTHRACAQLCIAGGLPPMLVTRDAEGNMGYFLIIGPDGARANGLVRPFVAEPVEVRGELLRLDEVVFLRIDEDGIQRL